MKEIDKTKQNIRVNEIDESQRKRLLNKFKDAGGKVISEREARRNLIIDREKQRQHQKKLDSHYNNKRIPAAGRIVTSAKSPAVSSIQMYSPFDRFRIRMRLRFLGITGINTVFFKKAFFQKFNDQYKSSLIEIQMIYFSLFKKDPNTGNRIIRSLDKISPIYYELIEKAGDIYEPYLVDQILEGYRNYPEVPQALSELRESFSQLFRLLYVLKPFENSIYNSFEKSIDINNSYAEGKRDKTIRKKDLKNALFIIFNKLYPRLHTLFCHYQGILFTESDKYIETILSISEKEKPGNRMRIDDSRRVQQETVETEKLEPEKETVTEAPPISDAVREGLKLMYGLDNKTLRSIYDKKGEFELLSDSDKILLTFMLYLEFENEYSFILTSNKIKYNVDFSTNIKIDYRIKMQDLFNRYNKCRDTFKNYYETYLEYTKIYNQKPESSNQYIAYSKRVDEIEKKMKQAGAMSRMMIKSFMDNLTSELAILIDDMNSRQRFIANPQDILEFNYEIEGDKKLRNKKIYQAIDVIFHYASALSYRISGEGDLSGKLEFQENEKLLEAEDENLSGKNSTDESKEGKSNGSILDELDDII